MKKRSLRTVGMAPPHPGASIRDEVLAPLGLSVAAAAKVLAVRRATLSDLIHGKAALSPEMALRLEMAFELDMEQMLRMQAWYDATAVRNKRDQLNVKRHEQA